MPTTKSIDQFPTAAPTDDLLPLAGGSPAAVAARAAFERAAVARTPALVTGEPGCRALTVAEALHRQSAGGGPLVSLDCAAGDPLDVERQLLGPPSDRTDSDVETVGRDSAMLRAAGGTLCLAHVDELPAPSQRRLARVLRDGEVRLSCGPQSVRASFRLIAATTRDLEIETREGHFRPDLWKRLSACHIEVPPLRRRPADLPLLVEQLARLRGHEVVAVTAPALTVLTSLPWTRNIDELDELICRILEAGARRIQQEDVLRHLPLTQGFGRIEPTSSLREAKRRFERDYIAAVLERHRWSMRDAARTLGIERANLYRKTRQLGITRGPRDTWPVAR